MAQGAQELPRQFTEPRGLENADNADLELENADNADLELPTDRRKTGSGPEDPQVPQERSQLPIGPLPGLSECSGPTRFGSSPQV